MSELETTVLIGIGRELVILFAEGTEKDRSLAGALLKSIITVKATVYRFRESKSFLLDARLRDEAFAQILDATAWRKRRNYA